MGELTVVKAVVKFQRLLIDSDFDNMKTGCKGLQHTPVTRSSGTTENKLSKSPQQKISSSRVVGNARLTAEVTAWTESTEKAEN